MKRIDKLNAALARLDSDNLPMELGLGYNATFWKTWMMLRGLGFGLIVVPLNKANMVQYTALEKYIIEKQRGKA